MDAGLKTKEERGRPDSVVNVHWEKVGTDELGNTGSTHGDSAFSSMDVPDEAYVPFQALTKAVVKAWVGEAESNPDREAYLNAQIQQQIDAQANPVVDAQMPWESEPAPIEEPTP